MRICAAQLQSIAGEIAANTARHLELIDLAIAHGADVVFFPELSLTGYEPRLAKSLATDESDRRLDVLQQRSDTHGITIGAGLPIVVGSQVRIGTVWFAPRFPRRVYAKQLLHADELPFFAPGDGQLVLEAGSHTLAPAICYESLQVEHADKAASVGADIYLASVAKPAHALEKAMLHYPSIARRYGMYVVMADGVGPSDDFVSVGQSAAWNKRGELLAQMDSASEGLVMVDTVSGTASTHRT
jgi:predicted amidohydrolase